MHGANRTWAWFQGMSLVACMGVLAALLLLGALRPFDQDTLAILTGQLRSDAHEARELVRLDTEHIAYATFTRQHARELGEHAADLANSLRGNRALASLEPARREAEELARSVSSVLASVAGDPAFTSEKAAAELERLGARIDMLHVPREPRS